MRGLNLKKLFRNEKDDALWSQEETDFFLNWYFRGMHWVQMARRLKRHAWSPEMRQNHILYTPFDKWIQDYQPGPKRENREGYRFVPNDARVLANHFKKGVDVAVTARILGRNVDEVSDAYMAVTVAGLRETIKEETGIIKEFLVREVHCAIEPSRTKESLFGGMEEDVHPEGLKTEDEDNWEDDEEAPENHGVKVTLEGNKASAKIIMRSESALENGLTLLEQTLRCMMRKK